MRRWWANPRVPLSPINKMRGAWIIMVATIALYPLAALSFAAEEPPWILALSFAALWITCVDIIATTDVGADVNGDNE